MNFEMSKNNSPNINLFLKTLKRENANYFPLAELGVHHKIIILLTEAVGPVTDEDPLPDNAFGAQLGPGTDRGVCPDARAAAQARPRCHPSAAGHLVVGGFRRHVPSYSRPRALIVTDATADRRSRWCL